MQKAVEWGVAAFKAAGADDVRTEEFSLQASWSEGATRMAIVAPEPFSVRAISLAWAPALGAQRRVPIVDVGHGTAEDFSRPGNFQGAVLLVQSDEMKKWEDLFAEYLNAPGIIDRAVKGKALAIASSPRARMICCIGTTIRSTARSTAFRWCWSLARTAVGWRACWHPGRSCPPIWRFRITSVDPSNRPM
jgi:hypothetical protein